MAEVSETCEKSVLPTMTLVKHVSPVLPTCEATVKRA